MLGKWCTVKLEVKAGNIAAAILHSAQESKANLIVLGARHRSPPACFPIWKRIEREQASDAGHATKVRRETASRASPMTATLRTGVAYKVIAQAPCPTFTLRNGSKTKHNGNVREVSAVQRGSHS